jgi:hypothetical protein
MPQQTYLSGNEWVQQRPFTHPDHIQADQHTLRHIAGQLHLLLSSPDLNPTAQPPYTILLNHSDDGDWFHRIVLAAPERLRRHRPLTIVGFFGQKQETVDSNIVHKFDRTLIAEIPQHPGLLSYSSMALEQGNYANLVIFSDGAARDHWSTSQAHVQAVQQLSPDFYRTVTIYNGRLSQGINHHQELTVVRVKYYDYQCQPRWQAVREIPPGA